MSSEIVVCSYKKVFVHRAFLPYLLCSKPVKPGHYRALRARNLRVFDEIGLNCFLQIYKELSIQTSGIYFDIIPIL